MDEILNVVGVDVILFLQRSLPTYGLFFMRVTQIGDPTLAFTFYFPLIAALCLPLGASLLWTVILCEWVNMILKWMMAGDRPYWWVHETPYYLRKSLPNIRQYPLTCETGPGMPSGHSTLNAALFFLLTKEFTSRLKPFLKKYISDKKTVWIIRSIWATYAGWLCLVMISRIFMGTHFPHQCLLGGVIGIATAVLVSSTTFLNRMSKKKAVFITLFMLGSIAGVFGVYRALGNDPMWSVSKAVRWCMKREFIHLDSIPFYSLSRYTGQALGLGLGLASSHYAKARATKFSWKMTLSLAILNLMTGQACSFIHRLLPTTMFGYYPLEFLLNTLLAYIIIVLLPRFVITASGAKPKARGKTK